MRQYQRALKTIFALILVSCATEPTHDPLTESEKIRRDRISGNHIAESFEERLKIVKKDMDLLVYLRNLSQKLAESDPQIQDAPIGIFIYKPKKNTWRNYALPGNRFYLSLNFLKSLSFENEVAAALALEMGHIIKRHTLGRLEALRDLGILPKSVDEGVELSESDYFGIAGIFSFTEENVMESISVAVDILYNAGYDPRGMTNFWTMQLNAGSASPYEKEALQKYLEKTREIVAKKSPLRNPVVRTEEFIQMKKRITRL